MLTLTLVLALFVGITVGVLGGGGSVLSVPLLAFVAGMSAKQAIGVAHLVVGMTSAVTAIPYARAGRIQWRTGAVLGGAGFVGAYVGGLLARFVDGTILLIGFASVVIATGFAMLRRRDGAATGDDRQPLPMVMVIVGGLGIGMVSGLVGAGGGLFVVPFLTLVGGLSMPLAVGTSLIVVATNSFAGLGGYLASVHIDLKMAAAVTAVTVIGGQIGARVHTRVDPNVLRKAFGWFALAISSIIFGREINAAAGVAVAALTALGAAIMLVRRRLKRRAQLGRDGIDSCPNPVEARSQGARKVGNPTGSRWRRHGAPRAGPYPTPPGADEDSGPAQSGGRRSPADRRRRRI